jgi:Zn-dependent protease with chaperone function
MSQAQTLPESFWSKVIQRISGWIDHAVVSRWMPWCCAVFVFSMPIVFVVWGMPAVGVYLADNVPVSWEHRLGRYVLRVLEMQNKPTKLSVSVQTQYASRVNRLASLANVASVEVYFQDAPPNAFALPGNIMIITDGLIDLMGDPEMVDAVVAHELGHLQHRHALKSIASSTLFTTIVLRMNGQDGTAAKTGGLLAGLTLFPHFSRTHESQADEYAFALLKKNGQSPLLFAEAMHKFKDYQKTNKLEKAGYADSHPPTQERINAAEAAAEKTKN